MNTNFPSNWLRRGYIYIHPQDDMGRFPQMIFRENPATFIARQSVDSDGDTRAFSWGLYEDPSNEPDPDGMAAFMLSAKRSFGANNNYSFYPSPLAPHPMTQFLSVIMKRKEAQIISSTKIQEAISHKSLIIRGTVFCKTRRFV